MDSRYKALIFDFDRVDWQGQVTSGLWPSFPHHILKQRVGRLAYLTQNVLRTRCLHGNHAAFSAHQSQRTFPAYD